MAAPSQKTPVEQQATRNVTCLNTELFETQSHKEEIILNQVEKIFY